LKYFSFLGEHGWNYIFLEKRLFIVLKLQIYYEEKLEYSYLVKELSKAILTFPAKYPHLWQFSTVV
jgi:hypothetical protein